MFRNTIHFHPVLRQESIPKKPNTNCGGWSEGVRLESIIVFRILIRHTRREISGVMSGCRLLLLLLFLLFARFGCLDLAHENVWSHTNNAESRSGWSHSEPSAQPWSSEWRTGNLNLGSAGCSVNGKHLQIYSWKTSLYLLHAYIFVVYVRKLFKHWVFQNW